MIAGVLPHENQQCGDAEACKDVSGFLQLLESELIQANLSPSCVGGRVLFHRHEGA